MFTTALSWVVLTLVPEVTAVLLQVIALVRSLRISTCSRTVLDAPAAKVPMFQLAVLGLPLRNWPYLAMLSA